MRPGKIVLAVFGALTALVALGLAIAGGALTWIHTTERDDDGYYMTSTERFETPTYALTSGHIDLGADVWGSDWEPLGDVTARIVAGSPGGGTVFIGIAPRADADRFLAASAHDELTDVAFDPFEPTYRRHTGEAAPARPLDQRFWVASASGTGRQTLTWDIESGDWDVVIMNADAARGVVVDAAVGVKTGLLLPIGIGLLAGGLVLGAVAATMLYMALRNSGAGSGSPAPSDAAAGAPGAAAAGTAPVPEGAYPLRIDGRLDEPLSRWLWLVKWFLAIPHLLVLAFLWAAFMVLTVLAGFAILFTGRYPKGIFDFNVGVLRWTWRVTFYAFALGTDRYPPFSLQPDAGYPADLAVPYPATLSRGLVLVKWWLLALPHYLVVAVFGGTITWWAWGWGGDRGAFVGAGLIGILVLIAGVVLAVRGSYPRPVFDFVMGMERWTYRVWAYAALLRDEYPPFRLDNGGADPGAPPAAPSPPSAPTRDTSLVS